MIDREYRLKRSIVIVLVVLLILFNAYLLLERFAIMKAADSSSVPEDMTVNEHELTRTMMTVVDLLENDGLSIDSCQIFESNNYSLLSTSELFSSTTNSHILVCRISEYDCEQCVTYAIEKAISWIDEHNNCQLQLAVFGMYHSWTAVRQLKSVYSHCKSLTFYNVFDIGLPIENHGNPYYFIVDENMIVTNVFTPDKMHPKQTDSYFSMVSKKWAM